MEPRVVLEQHMEHHGMTDRWGERRGELGQSGLRRNFWKGGGFRQKRL